MCVCVCAQTQMSFNLYILIKVQFRLSLSLVFKKKREIVTCILAILSTTVKMKIVRSFNCFQGQMEKVSVWVVVHACIRVCVLKERQ